MTLAGLLHNSQALLPEIVLSISICLVALADMFTSVEKSKLRSIPLALLGVITATSLLAYSPEGDGVVFFSGLVLRDKLSLVAKLIFLIGTAISLFLAYRSSELDGYRHGEFCCLILGAALGACLLVSTNNILLFVVGLETLSLCSYVLAGFHKHDSSSAEASLKYMLYGSCASAMMLFGLSYIYGLSGSLEIQESMALLTAEGANSVNTSSLLLASLLVLCGLGFKIAMVPFHFWCPDTYQGAPTSITAFLSVVSKAAGFAAIIRFAGPVIDALGQLPISSSDTLAAPHLIFGLLAALSMTYGNLCALRQTDAKRLLAYSSIAHAGYLLLGLAVFTPQAVEAMMLYLVVFLFMNFTAFWVIIVLSDRLGGPEIGNFKGAAKRSPLLFVALFIALIALTGLPPTAGFAAKFVLFETVVSAGLSSLSTGATNTGVFYLVLALVGVINSAVSLYYYMKLASPMVFEDGEAALSSPIEAIDKLYAVVLALPLLLLINFGPLLDLVRNVVTPLESILAMITVGL